MRIAMVSEHASPLAAIGGEDSGGQNVHVAALAEALGRRGHEVVVYTRRDADDVPERVGLAPGVTVEHVPAGPAEELPKDALLPFMAPFADELRLRWLDWTPDVVHAHFWMSGIAALHASDIGAGVPVVQTFHALGVVKRRHQGAADRSPTGRLSWERWIGRNADLIIATCSDEVRELVAMGVPAERITVVPCGVDLERFTSDGERAARNGRPRILSMSRPVPRKGVDLVVEALAGLPAAELVVAGGSAAGDAEHPELGRLRATAAHLDVSDRVHIVGQVPRDDVAALIRSADVVVSAAWYEPFGMVPLEAMACGVPVVASAVGGHLDTVDHGHTGLLVPPGDVTALQQALRRLLDSPRERAALGAVAARRARERYGWVRIAADTESTYRTVVDRPLRDDEPSVSGAAPQLARGT